MKKKTKNHFNRFYNSLSCFNLIDNVGNEFRRLSLNPKKRRKKERIPWFRFALWLYVGSPNTNFMKFELIFLCCCWAADCSVTEINWIDPTNSTLHKTFCRMNCRLDFNFNFWIIKIFFLFSFSQTTTLHLKILTIRWSNQAIRVSLKKLFIKNFLSNDSPRLKEKKSVSFVIDYHYFKLLEYWIISQLHLVTFVRFLSPIALFLIFPFYFQIFFRIPRIFIQICVWLSTSSTLKDGLFERNKE